jgi:hypothetical protein
MEKSKIKKLLAILLAILFVVSLTAVAVDAKANGKVSINHGGVMSASATKSNTFAATGGSQVFQGSSDHLLKVHINQR